MEPEFHSALNTNAITYIDHARKWPSRVNLSTAVAPFGSATISKKAGSCLKYASILRKGLFISPAHPSKITRAWSFD